MTEEEPIPPRRRFRNKIYQVLVVIVGLQSLYLTLRSQTTTLNEWPPEITDHKSYCRPENYKSCRAGDWFGILKSRLPNGTAALKDICEDWADKPNAANARLIEAAGDDTLYLCRMKDPKQINQKSIP